MANEKTTPLLPCRSIDDIGDFYRMLGFEVTYRQTKPNPYTVVRREDLELHFFGLPDFDPEKSYGTCLVAVPDTGALFESFAEGMRAKHGKVLVSGIPRITRPRKRKNTGNKSGFSVVDPGGNWIRIFPAADDDQAETVPESKLAATLQTAIVHGESRGDDRQAARILDSALAKHLDAAGVVDRVEALVYRAELAIRLDDRERAETLLAQVRATELDDADRAQLGDTLTNVSELELALRRDRDQ